DKPRTTEGIKAPAIPGDPFRLAPSPPQGITVGAMREASAPSPAGPTGATDSALSELGYRAPKRGKRGPKSDDSGHKRVAEILADYPQWAENLKEACVTLANPPDGKPVPGISQAWSKTYSITGYGEVYEAIPGKEIQQHLGRRLALGRELLARNSRQ